MKRIYGVMIISICIFLITACGKSTEEKWQEQYDLGMSYLKEEKYEEAILAFKEAIAIDSKQMQGYIELSDIYLQQDNPDAAIRELEDALMLTETLDIDIEMYENLKNKYLDCLLEQIRFKLAGGEFDKAINSYNSFKKYETNDEIIKKIENGEGYASGLGNTPEEQRNGGRKLGIGNVELFLLKGKLYYEQDGEVTPLINNSNYTFSGSLNISGNWIYGLGYYDGMERTENIERYSDGYIIRYNLLTQIWETIGFVSGMGIDSNSDFIIYDDQIYFVQQWSENSAISGVCGQLWRMDLKGENRTRLSTWNQISNTWYIENGYFYYQDSSSYEDTPEILAYEPYDERFAWYQWFRIALDDGQVQQITNNTVAGDAMKGHIVGEEYTFEVPMGGERITYGENVYYFCGDVLFKTDEMGSNYDIIEIFKTKNMSDIATTGWEYNSYSNLTMNQAEMISTYQDKERFIIAIEDKEVQNGIYTRGNFSNCYIFDLSSGAFVEDEAYKSAILQIMPEMGEVIFTSNSIYVNEINSAANTSQIIRISKKTGEKIILDNLE